MSTNVDRSWFDRQFDQRGLSLRAVAKAIDVDPAALSRALNGKRRITVAEVAKIATILDVPQSDVLSHVTVGSPGSKPSDHDVAVGKHDAQSRRHPLFGCMRGVLTIPPDVDVTEPADPGLAGYMDRKFGSTSGASR